MAVVNPPFCSVSDVEGVWRLCESDDEKNVVRNLIADASLMIIEIPEVPTRITAGTLISETLRRVTKHMVRRVMINPTALRQFSASSDDSQTSGTYDPTISGGKLYITPEEINTLLGAPVNGTGGAAFTIRTYTGALQQQPPDPWIPITTTSVP